MRFEHAQVCVQRLITSRFAGLALERADLALHFFDDVADAQSVKVSETSAKLSGLRESVPLKITSAISPPRSDLADCSPSTQRTASSRLDLPQPFGPTMAVTPSWKLKVVLSAKDLKPKRSSDCKCMRAGFRNPTAQYNHATGVTSRK